MRKEKVKIASTRDGHPSREPLMPVVEFFIAKGGRTAGSNEDPFKTDAAGTTRCMLVGDTTLQDILDAFIFPEHVSTGNLDNPYISDSKHRTEIVFVSFEEYEERQAFRTMKRTNLRDRAAEARKRLAFKNGG